MSPTRERRGNGAGLPLWCHGPPQRLPREHAARTRPESRASGQPTALEERSIRVNERAARRGEKSGSAHQYGVQWPSSRERKWRRVHAIKRSGIIGFGESSSHRCVPPLHWRFLGAASSVAAFPSQAPVARAGLPGSGTCSRYAAAANGLGREGCALSRLRGFLQRLRLGAIQNIAQKRVEHE